MPLCKDKKTLKEELREVVRELLVRGDVPMGQLVSQEDLLGYYLKRLVQRYQKEERERMVVIPYLGETVQIKTTALSPGETPTIMVRGGRQKSIEEALQLVIDHLDLALTREERIPEKIVKQSKHVQEEKK